MTEASSHLLIVVAAVYFLPTIVCLLRLSSRTLSVFVVNLFLGWTFFGWVMALAWSVSPRQAA